MNLLLSRNQLNWKSVDSINVAPDIFHSFEIYSYSIKVCFLYDKSYLLCSDYFFQYDLDLKVFSPQAGPLTNLTAGFQLLVLRAKPPRPASAISWNYTALILNNIPYWPLTLTLQALKQLLFSAPKTNLIQRGPPKNLMVAPTSMAMVHE